MEAKKIELIDTHFHLDLFPDPAKVARQIEAQKIHTIAVTNAPSVFTYTFTLAAQFKYIYAAIGLHPELAVQRERELVQMWEWLDKTRYVGEIGLDYVTTDETNRQIQRRVFSKILERSATGNKILTIHSRRSAKDVISTIGDHYPGKIILHWFSDSFQEMERAAGFGFFFSVNSAMARSKKGRDIVARIPIERLLTETDAPFIQLGNRLGFSSNMEDTIRAIAEIRGLEVAVLQKQIRTTFLNLHGDRS